jgi:hypothetical protein
MLANGLEVVRGQMSPFQGFLKRGFDIVGATAGLVLLSPLIALVSLSDQGQLPWTCPLSPQVLRPQRCGV